MSTKVEIRCPNGPQRLLAILRQSGERPRVIPGDNLIEFKCKDCQRLSRHAGEAVAGVYHRYNIAGELVETHIDHG